MKKVGVFLLGFGAPASIETDDLESFLEAVTSRKPSPETVSGLLSRYEAIGGKSPFVEISLSQREPLKQALAQFGINTDVYFGMRFGSPSINEAVEEAGRAGVKKAMVLTLAPQFANTISEAYNQAISDAVKLTGADMELVFVNSYGIHTGFIHAVCLRLRELFESQQGLSPSDVPIIFTAHSLPGNASESRDYIDELERGAKMIAEQIGAGKAIVAFQSKGRAGGEWLGPTVEEVLEKLSNKDYKEVVVCPLGFIVENLETLYDLDIVAAEHARSLGIKFHRAGALNDSPVLIRAWAKIIMIGLESLS